MKIQRNKNWYFALIAALSGVLVLLIPFSFDIFQYGDNCGYMSLGVAFANGKGFINPALPGTQHFLWWPPGFPLFIALFVKIFGPHWYVLKLLIFLGLYVSFTLYAVMLYKEEQNSIKAALILTALCFSSGIHLLSSYLYSETFFVACTLFFFFIWYRWREKLTFWKVVILSIFAVYISTIRLIGAALPAALAVYMLIFTKQERSRWWYGIIPGLLLTAFIVISLSVPQLRIGSLRVVFGLHPQFGSIIAGGHTGNSVTVVTIISRYINKAFVFFRGYGLTLIPQALIRSAYDMYEMNRLKALIMALVTIIVITGGVSSSRKIKLMHLYVLFYLGVLFIYGPLYVRLIVPIIPFLFLYLYSGLEVIIRLLIKNNRIAVTMLVTVWSAVIFDNGRLSFTDPHRTMPARFGDEQLAKCIEWAVENVQPGEIVVSQNHSYVYLKRGPYCLPYNYAKTVNEFMSYLDEHTVKYIIVSPFNLRSHDTYMKRTREAEELYPDNFKKIFGNEGDASYILEYISNEKG